MVTPYKETRIFAKYPKQLIVMVTPEMFKRLDDDAKRNRLSRSEVGRTYLESAIEAADAEVAEAARADEQLKSFGAQTTAKP